MSSRRSRRSGRDRKRQRPTVSRPFILRTPLKPIELLSDDEIAAISAAAFGLAETAGLQIDHAESREILAAAGCPVDRENQIVRFPREIVEDALTKLPASFSLTPRNPEHRVVIGENALTFCLTSGPPNVHDRVRGRRTTSFQDYVELSQLAQSFDIIHLLGIQVVPPQDLPVETRHLDCMHANIVNTDKAYGCFTIGEQRAIDAIEMAAIARGCGPEDLRESPAVYTMCPVNSPRKFDEYINAGLKVFAEFGQPIIVDPFCLLGAMAPVSLMGGLTQQHAEALCIITLTQVIKPGAPVIYGPLTSNVDLKSGSPAFGTPEHARAIFAGGQLARHLGIPFRSSNVNSANTCDGQATYETMMSVWASIGAHANILYHAAGWMEGGLSASYEKLVIDVEILEMMASMLAPVDSGEDEFAVSAIKEVPPGGHFFGSGHTQARYQTAFYQPRISDWQMHESWLESGGKTVDQRATEVWQALLGDFTPPDLDDGIKEALDDYVARRKAEPNVAA